MTIFLLFAEEPADQLKQLWRVIAALDASEDVSRKDRELASHYLRLLAENSAALKAINARRGAARTSEAFEIAIDMLICRELHEERNAVAHVAKSWSVSKATARQYLSRYRDCAQQALIDLIDRQVGTRRERLVAIRSQLQKLRQSKVKPSVQREA